MVRGSVRVALLLLVVAGSFVFADDKNEKLIAKKEADAHAIVAKELVELAKWCGFKNAVDEARAQLDLGLEICPANKLLAETKKGLKETAKPVSKDFAKEFPGKKRKAYDAAAKAISDFMIAAGKLGSWDHFEERVEILACKLGSEQAVLATGAVYFEPYRKWFNPVDRKRLEDGGEFHEGKWLSAKEVAALNERHSKWSDPWVVSDDVHEITTNMSLRTAKTLLIHVGAYRDKFVSYVSDGWELRKPEGKLPIVVTETQQDFMDQLEKGGHKKKGDRMNMAAVYMHSSRPLNPVYATFEPRDESGATSKVGIEYVSMVLQHECTHQIATEYSYYDANHGRLGGEFQYWSVEGIATFMEVWKLGKTGWKLTHPNPKNRQTRASGNETAFAFCKENPHLPETLKGFFDLTHDHFVRADHYQIAATVSYFLLEGEGRKYRKGFLKLLQAVHSNKDSEKTLRECFPDVDFGKMHEEFKHFVADLKLDEVEKAN